MPIIPIEYVATSQLDLGGDSKKKNSGSNSFFDLMNQQQGQQGQNAFMNNDMTGGQMFMQWLGKMLGAM